MKRVSILLILSIMFFKSSAQSNVFNEQFEKKPVISEELTLKFEDEGVPIPGLPGNQLGAAVLALLPNVVDLGVKFASDELKKWEQSFTGEYDFHRSNIKEGTAKMHSLTLKRIVKINDKDEPKSALELKLKANPLNIFPDGSGKKSVPKAMYYSVNKLKVDWSKARINKSNKKLDYTINIKLSFWTRDSEGNIGEKKVIDLNPIKIPYVSVGKEPELKDKEGDKFISDIILMPTGGRLAEVGVKIVESNPYKIEAEKINKLFENNKDDIKTVINNILPKSENTGNNSTNTSGKSSKNQNKPVGNK